MALTRAQIQTAFQNSLGRAASASDENSYFSVSQSGALTDAQIFTTISNSREADQIADPVIRFYQAAFGRVPDQAGLQNAENFVRALGPSAATYQNLSNMFAQSTEFTNRFGTGTAVDAAYVQALYSTILGRAATSGEVDGYVNTAGATRGNVLYLVSQSNEAISVSDAAVNGFQLNAAQGTAVYTGSIYTAANGQPNTPGTNGQNLAFTVNVDNLVGGAGNDTFTADNTQSAKTLSVADSVTGGAGTDTLKVFLAAGDTTLPLPTLSSIEVLNINGGAITSLNAANISGLTSVVLDSSVQTAATNQNRTITTAGQSVTLANTQPTVANQTSGAAVVGGGITFTTQIASTNDTAANVTLSNVKGGTFTDTTAAAATITQTATNVLDIAGTKIAALNLTSTGSANAITLTNSAAGAALATLNITGDKALTLTENLAGLKTVSAGGLTGNLTLDTSAGTANAALAFTGGTGNDKVTFASGAFVSTQTFDGGAGTDTLVLKDTTFSDALYTAINAAKNTEVLGLGAGGTAGIALDVSKVTAFSQFSVEAVTTGLAGAAATNPGGAGVLFSGESNAQTFAINANITGGAGNTTGSGGAALQITPGFDNGSNAVNLTLNGVTLAGGAAGGGAGSVKGVSADLTSFESVTITSSGTTGNSLADGIKVGANATISLSGTGNIDLGTINAGATPNNNVTLTASSLSGNLTATTGNGNDVITAGSGVNAITLTGGVDSVNLSASTVKADTITLTSAATAATKAASVSITGFTNALNTGDTLDLNGTLSVATSGTATANTGLANAVTATINNKGIASFTAVGSSAALADYVDAVFGAINNASNKGAAFQLNGDTYVVEDNGTAGAFTAGTDAIVKLVGVTGVTELSTTAFGAGIVHAV
jgi:hypothetical protein